MSKVAVPIIKLKYNPRDAYPNEIHQIFVEEQVWHGDEALTFTGRVSMSAGDVKAKRTRIKERLATLFKEHYGDKKWAMPFKTLIRMLDQNNWDVSFYVDAW